METNIIRTKNHVLNMIRVRKEKKYYTIKYIIRVMSLVINENLKLFS